MVNKKTQRSFYEACSYVQTFQDIHTQVLLLHLPHLIYMSRKIKNDYVSDNDNDDYDGEIHDIRSHIFACLLSALC